MKQFISFFLALWILNLSVDIDHLRIGTNITEDKKIDDEDNMVELIVEAYTGNDKIFNEHHDPDKKSQSQAPVKEVSGICLFFQCLKIDIVNTHFNNRKLFSYTVSFFNIKDICLDILTPPPQFLV